MLKGKKDLIYSSLFFLFIVSLAGGSYMLNFKLFGVDVYAFRIFLGLNILVLFLNKDIVLYNSNFSKIVFYFLVSWILYGVVSLTWCADLRLAVHEVIYIVIGLSTYVYLYSISQFFKNDFESILFKNWIYALIPIFIISFIEISTGIHLAGNYLNSLTKLEFLHANNFVPVATFDNPNNLAIFLSLSLVILMVLIRQKKHVFFFSILFGVNFYLIVLTGSRIGIIFSSLLLLIWTLVNFKPIIMNTLKDMYLKIIGSILLFVLVFMFNPSDKVNRSQIENREHLLTEYHDKIKNEYGSNGYDSLSVNVRKNLILTGLDLAKTSYFIGVGSGSFEAKIRKGENKYPTFGMPNPHNYFIEVFSQYGILITLFLIGLFSFIGVKVIVSLYLSRQFEKALFILLLLFCYGLLSNANSSFLPLPLNWFIFSLIMIQFDKFYSGNGIKH